VRAVQAHRVMAQQRPQQNRRPPRPVSGVCFSNRCQSVAHQSGVCDLFILGRVFSASARVWPLIYITSACAAPTWPRTHSRPTTTRETFKTWTSTRCKSSSMTPLARSQSRHIKGTTRSRRPRHATIILNISLSLFPFRYLEYFFGLLSGEIKINSLPLYLKFIKMESPPCMHHKISYHESEWSSFIKIFEGERFVFISGRRQQHFFY
jgi:hypothetical protein